MAVNVPPQWLGSGSVPRMPGAGHWLRCALIAAGFASSGGRVHEAAGAAFATGPTWASGSAYTNSVAFGDVDGDGNLDLVRGNGRNGTLPGATLHLNRGGAFPGVPAWNGPPASTYGVALGDVDGDGDLDLVCGNVNEGATLFRNVGGTFASTPDWTGPAEATYAVALGDVDGDGDLDLIRGNNSQPSTLYRNTGGTFESTPAWSSPPYYTRSVALGDVDGDGDIDLVFGDYAFGAKLHRNVGGTFESADFWRVPFPGYQVPTYCVMLGDVDGDGDLDLISGNSGALSTLHENVGGTFGSAPIWSGDGGLTGAIALGDVNGDGLLDLICGDINDAARLYLGDGTRFATSASWSGAVEFTTSVALADVDGDGDLDLARGNFNQGTTLYINTSGLFDSNRLWTGTSGATQIVALGDVDGDGDLDLVRGNDGAGATLNLNTDGVLAAVPSWTGPLLNTKSVALGDVDGDGDLDLVQGGQQGLSLFPNLGGTFASTAAWTAPEANTSSVALGDVNGDGRLDVACGRTSAAAALYLGNGTMFASSAAWRGPVEATRCVALGDVNGDGRLDLVRGNDAGGSTLYLGSGSTFASTPSWTGPAENTKSVALADVDGDGDLDLVRGNFNQGSTLYRNTGVTLAGTPAWTGPPELTTCVALVDVDLDGDLDLIRGNTQANNVLGSTLSLNSGGTFEINPVWTGPTEPTASLALGDVDGDGDPDLVLGNAPTTLVGTSVHVRVSPWTLPLGTPRRHLVNNSACLRWVRVTSGGVNQKRISFRAVDAESDSIRLLGEYQLAGQAVWHSIAFANPGPFATSAAGVPAEIAWDVSGLPLDRREIVLRLRALSPPRHAGVVQSIPSYALNAGRIVPARPILAASPATLTFPTVTVGDSAFATLTVSNPGTLDLVIDHIESPDPAVIVAGASGATLAPGGQRVFDVLLAPREGALAPGVLRIIGNDPLNPGIDITLVTDVRALVFQSRLLATAAELPLAEAVTVLVTPAPAVHVERGFVVYRPRGIAAFSDSAALVWQGPNFAALVPGRHVTEAGLEYFVRVENSGVLATDPPDAPASFFFQAVAAPGGITATAQPDPDGEYPAGRPTPVTVALPEGAGFEGGWLCFRPGGSALHDSVALEVAAPGALVAAAQVPGAVVGPRGVEFWTRVVTLTRTLTDPATDPSGHPHSLRVRVGNLQEPSTHAAGRYRMITVPLDLNLLPSASLEALIADEPDLGAYDATRWRCFRYAPESGAYAELSPATAATGMMRPEPGRAFWLITKPASRVGTAPASGRTVPTDSPYRVTLLPGWNQVGSPFPFPVEWSGVSAIGSSGPVVIEPPVAWDEAGHYRNEDVTTLEPFEGYWVMNPAAEPVDLLIPPREAPAPPTAPAGHGASRPGVPSSWRVQVAVSGGGATDTRNFAGVDPAADEDADALDRSEAPLAPGPAVSLYFLPDAPGAGPAGMRRSADVRPALAPDGVRGHAWRFDVARGDDEIAGMRIDLAGIDGVPEDLEIRLVDRVLNRTLDVRREPGYAFAMGRRDFVASPASARFELLIGTPGFVADASGGRGDAPRETRLRPCSPNPVVAATIIRFETASAGRVRVQLYDVTGRRVCTVADGWHEAGWHEQIWRGNDDRGRRLPAGVYAVVVAAPGRTVSTRLVLQ